MFDKIKNRYENNSSANENIILDGKKKTKKCLITNQDFLNNQEKANDSDEASKSKDMEGKKETNLKMRHSGVIDKLNSFYGEKMGDHNDPLMDKENYRTNNKSGHKHEKQLEENATHQTENRSKVDKLDLVSNSNTVDHKSSLEQNSKHIAENIENDEQNKHMDVLSQNPNDSPGLDITGLKHGICEEKIEDQPKTKPDNNEADILPNMKSSDKRASPNTEKKDDAIINKANQKDEHNMDKAIKKDEHTILKINQNNEPKTTNACKKYDRTIPQVEGKDNAPLENFKNNENVISESNNISKNTVPKINKNNESIIPEANKKDIISQSNKQVNDLQYDEVCSISTSHVEPRKQDICSNSSKDFISDVEKTRATPEEEILKENNTN